MDFIIVDVSDRLPFPDQLFDVPALINQYSLQAWQPNDFARMI
jgi:hypothetical protein